jgi:hypothetical protein
VTKKTLVAHSEQRLHSIVTTVEECRAARIASSNRETAQLPRRRRQTAEDHKIVLGTAVAPPVIAHFGASANEAGPAGTPMSGSA